MAPLNQAILALFSIFFALIRYLKSTFLLLFGKIGGEGALKPEEGELKQEGMRGGGGGGFWKTPQKKKI